MGSTVHIYHTNGVRGVCNYDVKLGRVLSHKLCPVLVVNCHSTVREPAGQLWQVLLAQLHNSLICESTQNNTHCIYNTHKNYFPSHILGTLEGGGSQDHTLHPHYNYLAKRVSQHCCLIDSAVTINVMVSKFLHTAYIILDAQSSQRENSLLSSVPDGGCTSFQSPWFQGASF